MSNDVPHSNWQGGETGKDRSEYDALERVSSGRFYRVDSTRTSFVELWRDARSPVVLVAWLAKLLRIKVPGTVNDPNVVSLAPFVVAPDRVSEVIPESLRKPLFPLIRELADLGFQEPQFYYIEDRFHLGRTCQAVLFHENGGSVARVTRREEGENYVRKHQYTELVSEIQNGELFCSSSALSQLFVPDCIKLNWLKGASPSRLWLSHREALGDAASSVQINSQLNSKESAAQLVEKHHEAVRDFHLERGLFSSLEGDDLEHAILLDENVNRARQGGLRYPEVITQLRRIERAKTNWSSAFIMLLVTMALFVTAGAGLFNWSWDMAVMIVGILLVHEAGHFLAMKVFGYRNVKMFFIPLFGAAVMGQNFSAATWKKVMVSLMGPLPGIVIGAVLGIIGFAMEHETLMNIATLAVILNGFQLLPFMPLDGGRIMHAILFCRHPVLEAAFQATGALALMVVGGAFGDWILSALGTFLLLSSWSTYKTARIGKEVRESLLLRGENSDGDSSGEGSATADDSHSSNQSENEVGVPTETAEAIVDRLSRKFASIKAPKLLANMTLTVYENATTRPTGVFASLGFAALHGGSFLATIVVVLVFAMLKSPDLQSRLFVNETQLAHRVAPDRVRSWLSEDFERWTRSVDDTSIPPALDTIVATFKGSNSAERMFEQILENPSTASAALVFGKSVCLVLPTEPVEEVSRWFDLFESKTEDVFLTDGIETEVGLNLSCTCSDFSLRKELNGYLNISEQYFLVPPWIPPGEDLRSDAEKRQHGKARGMLVKLNDVSLYDAPELMQIREEITRAVRRNDVALRDELWEQQTQRIHELKLSRWRELATVADEVGRQLANQYIDQMEREYLDSQAEPDEVETEEEFDLQKWNEEFYGPRRLAYGELLGQLPISSDTGRPARKDMAYSTTYGNFGEGFGGMVVLSMSFEQITVSVPQLLHWLESRGATDFEYEFFQSGSGYGYDY